MELNMKEAQLPSSTKVPWKETNQAKKVRKPKATKKRKAKESESEDSESEDSEEETSLDSD